MKKLVICLIVFSATRIAHAKTEFGRLQNAEFRIDVPDQWNHGLVVYYHGYDTEDHGMSFDRSKPLEPSLAVFTAAGYAVIQSGYSRGGWALEQAIPETEALRKYFIEHYGLPGETFVAGHSMGGMLTVMTIEQSPELYAAGLDLCGAVADAPSLFGRGFDLRIVFDYFFPQLLPDPSKVPPDYKITEELKKKITGRLEAKPQAAASLRGFIGVRNDKDLVFDLLFTTWTLKDVDQRSGGNPFDNRNTIYTGTGHDNAVNAGVKRYAADPRALTYLERYYTPHGHLARPVLAIHTTYDPLVSPSIPSSYAQLTRKAGAGDSFVVQYVEREGHCNFTAGEVDRGFAQLRQWKEKGTIPTPGKMQELKISRAK
jgi:pimeloyl-ACP methyl ester carboxylesterase